MKNAFCILSLFLFMPSIHAQLIMQQGQCVGANQFILRSAKASFTLHPLTGGEYTVEGRRYTLYAHAIPLTDPLAIDSRPFHSILLTFDDSDQLVSFSMIRFYKKIDDPFFEKKAKKDYQAIAEYVATRLHNKGESKTYYKAPKALDKGLEWTTASTLLKVKKASFSTHSTVQFSFGYIGH